MSTATAEHTEQREIRTSYSSEDQQYLTFNLAEEYYGVDILKVQEIKGYTTVTRIPNTPDYLKGVLNLRGTIVPIVDLRMKFGMGTTEPTPFTVVVVVNVRNRVMGFLVDAVSDVLDLNAKQIQPPPELGSAVDINFVAGIGNANDRLVTLLDIDRVLTDEEVAVVSEMRGGGEAIDGGEVPERQS
ncbi:MAG: chemotaxis protein CheW [Nitrospirales bacterium]|nr:purine-binding chemotaxis protein CheW [Nitrospira sp.]MCA9480643.1 purine-binding chemotaxis protein CheW [Nitrospira sp.]MCB9711403.1 purine-binding chemotaxis protein CheW [Nitrospiraceae bacterium]MDR4486281.1 chemotaxis protein CheW [Nitrospirales bacterium]HQU29111.1 chemotaxis protein CheW [Nitrospirales bacterium]